jgi:hypothetical protein
VQIALDRDHCHTTRTAASRKIASRELQSVESVLRKILLAEVQYNRPDGIHFAHLDGIELAPSLGDPEIFSIILDDFFLRFDHFFSDRRVNDNYY